MSCLERWSATAIPRGPFESWSVCGIESGIFWMRWTGRKIMNDLFLLLLWIAVVAGVLAIGATVEEWLR